MKICGVGEEFRKFLQCISWKLICQIDVHWFEIVLLLNAPFDCSNVNAEYRCEMRIWRPFSW